MADVSASIQSYITNSIRLRQKDISASATSREWLLGRISSVIAGRLDEPVLYAAEPFVYFGSAFKGTKVQVLDEYDVLVVIDSNTGVFSRGGVAVGTGQGAASPNHKYDSKYYKQDGTGVSPTKMLNWLKGVVQEAVQPFGGQTPERRGQAVTAYIKSSDILIDLVPAGVFTRDSDGSTFYNIPRGDASLGWIATSPRLDIDRLKQTARDKNDFCNVVRIAKRIKDTCNFTVSSFAVESAVVDYGIYGTWNNNLFDDVRVAIGFLAQMFRRGTISDPYDATNNLIDGVSSLSWYADRLDAIVVGLSDCAQLADQNKANERVVALFENQ